MNPLDFLTFLEANEKEKKPLPNLKRLSQLLVENQKNNYKYNNQIRKCTTAQTNIFLS